MRTVVLCLLAGVLAGPVFSQTGAVTSSSGVARRSSATARTTANAPAPRFKPDIPVSATILTLNGVCQTEEKPTAKSSTAAADCKTIITRGQLEALVAAIDPEASPKMQQQFALGYARLLAASKLAEKQRMDKDPKINREIQLQQSIVRMQILTDYILRGLQKQAQHVPNEEIEAYYKENAARFEVAVVQRVAVPFNATTESGKALDQAAVKAEMDELRKAVDKGDDFEFLQSKAYKDLNVKDPAPATTINMARYQALSPEEMKVFDMPSGEATPVFETQGALMMLRLVDKRKLPLNEVRTQVEASLALRHELDSLHAAFQGIDAQFNLKYLDAQSQPELFPLSVITQSQNHRTGGGQAMMKAQQ
jgi:hypothetical protein